MWLTLRLMLLCPVLIGCSQRSIKQSAQAPQMAPVPAPMQYAAHISTVELLVLPQNHRGGFVNRNSPLRSKFWVAIRDGDVRTVSDLITENMNLNFMVTVPSDMRDEKGRETTPLLEAVAGGHPEMVEFLIQHGSAVNFHPAETGSALHWAAWSGNSKVVMVLLRHGASVNERNYYGEAPLILAATHSADISVVKELIAAGANVHAQSKVGDNAVMGAAWQHHLDTVKLLVGLGVDACAKNNKGETAIDQARSNLNEDPGKQEIIAFLQVKCGRQ